MGPFSPLVGILSGSQGVGNPFFSKGVNLAAKTGIHQAQNLHHQYNEDTTFAEGFATGMQGAGDALLDTVGIFDDGTTNFIAGAVWDPLWNSIHRDLESGHFPLTSVTEAIGHSITHPGDTVRSVEHTISKGIHNLFG